MQIKAGSRKEYHSFIKEHGLFSSKWRKLKDNAVKKERSLYSIVFRLFEELKEKRSQLILIIVIGFVSNLLITIFPWVGKYMIDYVLPQKNIILLMSSCSILFLIAVVDIGVRVFLDYKTNVISGIFAIVIKNRMMKHLQKLSLSRIQELKVGGVISRLQQDTAIMSSLLFEVIVSPLNAGVMFIIAITSLFFINWKVTIIFVVFGFFIGGIGFFVFNIMRPFQKKLRDDNTALNTQLVETFGGMMVVRSFCREQSVKHEYGYNIGLLWRKMLYGNIIGISLKQALWFIFYFTQIFIWLLGGYNVINSSMTIGEIVVFISFVPFVFNPIFNIMALFSQLQQSLACADRIFDLLDEEVEIFEIKNALIFSTVKEGIEFHNVTFDYPDGTRALKNISIKIPKGKVTAFVGPSGGGKTTLINLILRFYEATKGRITIDSINIRKLNLHNYRKLLSLVPQEVFLFDGTIKENISYGNPKAQQDEIEKVAKTANCYKFIQKLQDQYNTIIGEKGVKLSYGQKQRLVLARALLTDPQILILDEATSNLDSESEASIQVALKEIFKEKTSVVIAHRLSTILEAENIIFIEEGRVIEQGNFDDLLRKKGRFMEIYQKQRRKIEQNYIFS